jgi:hypothetical protein
MVQVPTATKVATLPLTVQTAVVVEAKLTGRPEFAVAFRVNDPVANICDGIAGKEID